MGNVQYWVLEKQPALGLSSNPLTQDQTVLLDRLRQKKIVNNKMVLYLPLLCGSLCINLTLGKEELSKDRIPKPQQKLLRI